MPEDQWEGVIKIDCPKCRKPVGKIPKDTAEGTTLIMTCKGCGHNFDYKYEPSR